MEKKRNCNHRCLETNIHTLAWVPMFQCVKCYLLLEHTHTHIRIVSVFFFFIFYIEKTQERSIDLYSFSFIILLRFFLLIIIHLSFVSQSRVEQKKIDDKIHFFVDLVSFLF